MSVEYIILTNMNVVSLAEEVERYSVDGWQVLGGPVVRELAVMQAMTRQIYPKELFADKR